MLILGSSHNHLIVQHLPKKREVAIQNLSHVSGFEPQLWRAVLSTAWQSTAVEGGQQCWRIPQLKVGTVEKTELPSLMGEIRCSSAAFPGARLDFHPPSFTVALPPPRPQKQQQLLPCASSKSLVSYFCCGSPPPHPPTSVSLAAIVHLSAGTGANVDEGIWLWRQLVLLEGPLCLWWGTGDGPENLFCRLG